MEVTISGRHVDVTDAMRGHARERIEKFQRYASHLMRVEVTLSIEGDRHQAEVVAKMRRHGELVAKSTSQDMYASIDDAVVKLERQIQKTEERIKEHREAAVRRRPVEAAGTLQIEESEEEPEEEA